MVYYIIIFDLNTCNCLQRFLLCERSPCMRSLNTISYNKWTNVCLWARAYLGFEIKNENRIYVYKWEILYVLPLSAVVPLKFCSFFVCIWAFFSSNRNVQLSLVQEKKVLTRGLVLRSFLTSLRTCTTHNSYLLYAVSSFLRRPYSPIVFDLITDWFTMNYIYAPSNGFPQEPPLQHKYVIYGFCPSVLEFPERDFSVGGCRNRLRIHEFLKKGGK